LIVDQLTYHFRAPERGDVVVFRYPNDTSVFFIKRIIGLPRETVRIDEEGTHIIDQTGKETLLKEPFTAPHTQNADGVVSLTLGADEYFVMGDNRDASSDSRVWGAVPAKDIMGRAFLRLLPASHLSLFPGYFHL
jgi:signal peptidase I